MVQFRFTIQIKPYEAGEKIIVRNIGYYRFFVAIIVLISQNLTPQNLATNLKFSHITADDGLSQSYVVCALQDSRGFMWFGTQDGLNRYDGYNFKLYRKNPADSNSLSENWIWSIYEDSDGFLWIGTFGGGACRFDRTTQTFTRYQHDSGDSTTISANTIWTFCEFPEGVFWIGANNGLNRFDSASGTFTYYKPSPGNPLIFKIIPGGNGKLWMTTIDGLYEFDIQSETFQYYGHNPDDPASLGTVGRSMAIDPSGIIWLGTGNEGLNRFDPIRKTVTRYHHNPGKPESTLLSNHVLDVHADEEGIIWAATDQGLSLLKFDGERLVAVRNFQNNPANPHSLIDNYLNNIYESRTGEVWISARTALHRFDRYNRKFTHYFSISDRRDALSHNGVLPILASQKQRGIIWIGTRHGLNRFNQDTGEFTHYFYKPDNPEMSISSNYILSLCEDSEGNLWVGTRRGGLTKMSFGNRGQPAFTHFRHDTDNPTSLGADNVHYIYEDPSGRLWVGTGGGGLNLFHKETQTFTRYPDDLDTGRPHAMNDLWAYNMLEDRQGLFWIGTAAGGLNLFDREKGTFRHFVNDPANPNSLSHNRVLGIFETSSGDLWIATAIGLNKLVRPSNAKEDFSFIQFHESDGLPNEIIYGVLEDRHGNLWVSTNKGLCKIRMENNRMKVRTYTVTDGLQGNEFSHNSYCRSVDGRMYFGGNNGFSSFYPDRVKDNPNIPPIVITDFKILNETVPIGKYRRGKNAGQDSPLKKDIGETKQIKLSYSDNVFSFEFAALNYTVPQKNLYAYKMEGFDEDWVYSGNRRFVTYTNLNPGEYTFRVIGSNNDRIWNNAGASIKIIITPPPWKTWWAYTLYFLI
ncbi:MAG: two-component regulator propeller domain-containing protein, partial [Calditrichia bacterium]